ncbi:hypothetical protein BBP40_000110 [Aspergillus hancockii]|nr:hypothetical protein BBP40_000110 [Aspergillus hancockii]
MENSRILTALDSDAEVRSSTSEVPALGCIGDSVPSQDVEAHGPQGDQHLEQPPTRQVRFSLPDETPSSSASPPATVTEGAVTIEQSVTIRHSPPPSSSWPRFVPGHRRRSTHVTRQDLDRFRRDVLGIETPGFGFDDESSLPAVDPAVDPQLENLNRDFDAVAMSMNSNGAPGSGVFSSYVDNPSSTPNMANVPRQSMSPAMPHAPGQVNGAGMAGMNGGIPMNAGHQMDLHHLYDMVLELSEVLKNNREMTKSIVTSAEDIMRRSSAEGASPSLQQVNGEISAARIAELERALAREKRQNEILRNEQVENTKLIGEYEQAVGTMVEQIRNYCQNNNLHYLSQKRHYNTLLQAERDAHLESRLDRDYWHAQTMKCAEMIRTAYRLRCEEEEVPIRIVAGLQNEVRAYRNALGMESERPEEEYGWEILKDVPGGPAPGE